MAAMSPQQKPDGKLTRKQAKARTRQKLIAALLEISREHGMAGLSTTRIAKLAGVSQSVFYDHFSDMNDALGIAAEQVGARVRTAMTAQREHIEPGNPAEAVRATFAAGIQGLLDEPMLAELLLRHRRDPDSPLGECIRNILADARADVIRDMERIGLRDAMPRLEMHADMFVAMGLSMVEGLLDGRYQDIEACLDVVARITSASISTGR